MDVGQANWHKAYFVPTKADVVVIGFRRWLKKYAGGEVDWKGKYSGALPSVVMRAVKNVVATGRTTVCTIHQPMIELGRAVYNDANIYILDDPFSVLDAQTASIIFHDCVMSALKEKTIILVTHEVEFLREFDKIQAGVAIMWLAVII